MIICRCAQRLRGLGALGLVLNCVTLWNTAYLDRALSQLRAGGYPVADTDAARLPACQRRHINIHGHYTVALPDLGGTHRALRDPDQPDGQEQTSSGPEVTGSSSCPDGSRLTGTFPADGPHGPCPRGIGINVISVQPSRAPKPWLPPLSLRAGGRTGGRGDC